MTDRSILAVDRLFREHRIRYVVIGGQAVARSAATATVDVDVMVTTDEYPTVVERLAAVDGNTKAWDGGAVTRLGIREMPNIPLDIVDSKAFSGQQTGAQFFEFLLLEGSTEVEGVRYATPAVVWYTRLLTKRWRAYAEKIVTNVIDGLDPRILDDVAAIGRRFQVEPTLLPRIEYVRSELARPDIQRLLGQG